MLAIGRKSICAETTTGAIVGMNFVEMDVHRPLATVAQMVRRGNIVVFGDPKLGSFVKNLATGMRHQLEEKNGILSGLSHLLMMGVLQQMATLMSQRLWRQQTKHPRLLEARRVFAGRLGSCKAKRCCCA